MSRRARAVAFALLALVCAAVAASLAGEYRGSVEAQLGELRSVVVAGAELSPREPLRPRDARELLDVRRVPARFAPVDALAEPFEAVGRSARAQVPAGAYVTASLLRMPRAPGPRPDAVGRGREAVEIAIAGAGALAAAGDPVGRNFDVVATAEPGSDGGDGRTAVVAEGVELVGLRESGPSAGGLDGGGPTAWTATLAVGRKAAIRLIQAHNYAREVRLIGSG